MIPKGVKKVLDIGSRGDIFKEKYSVVTIDNLQKSSIKQDLNLNQKLNFQDNKFDLVVINQILEHLNYVEEIISESKRVSKKYLLVGLPNEVVYSLRIKFLLGKIEQAGYQRYGHKHRFNIEEIEKFIKEFFGNYEFKKYWGAFTGAKFLPDKIKAFLANNLPSLFAKEVYYLIKIK